jgi:hypothetical protein
MMRLLGSSSFMRACAAAWLLASMACYTSPRPEEVALSDPQHGGMVALFMNDGTERKGELLTVRTDSFILLLDGRVAIAPLSAIHTVGFDGVPLEVIEDGRMSSRLMDVARAESRFPFGITPPAMATLLKRSGQDAPMQLGPKAP